MTDTPSNQTDTWYKETITRQLRNKVVATTNNGCASVFKNSAEKNQTQTNLNFGAEFHRFLGEFSGNQSELQIQS
jgi:hypothetical protein